jgi:hypothetical protein
MHQNYLRDLLSLRFSSVHDGTMEFTRRADHARQKVSAGKDTEEETTKRLEKREVFRKNERK